MSLLKINSIVYDPDEDLSDDGVDDFPTFVVSGVFIPTGDTFTRKVALELDGREVYEEHVDGLDLDKVRDQDGKLSEELYEAVYTSPKYQEMAAAYHGW